MCVPSESATSGSKSATTAAAGARPVSLTALAAAAAAGAKPAGQRTAAAEPVLDWG